MRQEAQSPTYLYRFWRGNQMIREVHPFTPKCEDIHPVLDVNSYRRNLMNRPNHIRERLLKLDTASICDAYSRVRLMDSAIRAIRPGIKFAGVARTAVCRDDYLTVLAVLAEAQAGDVIVVDCQGSRKAISGELFATEAMRRGISALVVDGAVRDAAGIRNLPFPVYARFITPMAGTASQFFQMQIPIQCGGVVVQPGEYLFGDDDGIVVGTEKEFSEILESAEAVQNAEARVLDGMKKGRALHEMVNFKDHRQAILRGESSKLQFRP